MTLDRGTRDDATARSPVSARFVLSCFSPAASPSSFGDTVSPSVRLPSSLSSSSSTVRNVGRLAYERAAVNSPTPLSALMSLLLFALLNAIRAYSVSLLLEPRATTSSFQLPRKRTAVTRTRARISEILSRSRIPQQVHTNTQVRAIYTDGRLTRGIAP